MDDDLTVRLYRAMVFARTYDRKSMAMQKQGRLATYAPFEGQEAAQVGKRGGPPGRRLDGGDLSGRRCDVDAGLSDGAAHRRQDRG